MPILRKLLKEKRDGFLFGNVVSLQRRNLLKSNPTIIFGITEISFWWIFQNSYYMESLQIIDKFFPSFLVIFSNMAYIFMQVIRNEKIFHRFSIFYYHNLAMLCDWLTFIAQCSNILLSSFLTSLCCSSICILKIKFWILETQMEDQICSPEKYWMKNSYKKKYVLLEWKKYIREECFLLNTNLFWLNKNIFWYHEKKIIWWKCILLDTNLLSLNKNILIWWKKVM